MIITVVEEKYYYLYLQWVIYEFQYFWGFADEANGPLVRLGLYNFRPTFIICINSSYLVVHNMIALRKHACLPTKNASRNSYACETNAMG